jgi:transcriptional regulator with XRE-family HTH domain
MDLFSGTTFVWTIRSMLMCVESVRTEKGWSQERFADEAGLHRNYIGAIERGEMNVCLDNMVKLANTLRCKITELFRDF